MKTDTPQFPDAIVLGAIRDIQNEKRAAKRFPDHVTLIDDKPYTRVCAVLTPAGFDKVLHKLEDAGLIVIGNTLNDTYVRPVEFTEMKSKM